MKRKPLLLLSIMALVVIAATSVWLGLRAQRRNQAIREALGVAFKEMGHQAAASMSGSLNFLQVERTAVLEGDTTVLTLTLTNGGTSALSGVQVDQPRLGKVIPRENPRFPMQVGRLAPGTAKTIVLHFEKVPWNLMGSGQYAQATIGLDLQEEWTEEVVPATPSSTNVTVSSGPAKSRISYQGIPVELDQRSVPALEEKTRSRP